MAAGGMEQLKAEVARKRRLLQEKELLGESKKYFKRSDLAKKEEEVYLERCGYQVQTKTNEEDAASSNPVLELELAEEKLPMTLSRQEVIRRLRERGEPIRLFAETDYEAFQRLRKIEILTPEINKGLRNDLKAAMDKIDQQYLNEIVAGQEQGEEEGQNDLKVHEENTTIEELEALGESLGQGDDNKDMDIITKVLRFLLDVWAKDLNAREDYLKCSVQGKLAGATHKQTESYLKPLFRKLRKKTLSQDIKESITDIIKFMLQREYVKRYSTETGPSAHRICADQQPPIYTNPTVIPYSLPPTYTGGNLQQPIYLSPASLWRWEETGAPGENPRGHRENLQTPHRQYPASNPGP
ncbi:pre-mRNA-splicing factor 18 isoform X1 [Heterodontus francisci]|uniref:pre-mRNA-splicing factor 18 isoform X1 n=1 Tax=Heterodontus francisci TaxID=7792 RepID=UPI00355B97D8